VKRAESIADFTARIAEQMKGVPEASVTNPQRVALRKLLTRPVYYPPSQPNQKGKRK
jgi:hypothetical protein